ncbi:hypothetical protein FRB96_008971 [Tulasnella sp. 330]|nr:hypothetical protein FRB96_008971 [Tulasnella sp. 330]
MKIAVEGCCHGELDATYKRIEELETQNGYSVELLLICGDFQAVRTQADLNCMSVPAKYLQMGDFHKYYSGERVAPILTVVIGGNHEASNYFWELYHGGWLAPNIYYLGCAGVVQFNGIRIAGASGIFKSHDYRSGHYETLPYDRSSMRSAYHIRQYDVIKLLQIRSPDIFLSHDWPQSIERHGDLQGLLRRKKHFKEDVDTGNLGSPPLMEILKKIRPRHWFAAHLHVKFEAEYVHAAASSGPDGNSATATSAVAPNPDEIQISMDDDEEDEAPLAKTEVAGTVDAVPLNSDEIVLDDEEDDVQVTSVPAGGDGGSKAQPGASDVRSTRFLALDKCLPRRSYLEVVDIDPPLSHDPPRFAFDSEWLGIVRATNPYLSISKIPQPYPPPAVLHREVAEAVKWVREHVSNDDKDIGSVQVFHVTSPGNLVGFKGKNYPQPSWYTNPQTVAFCDMIGIENKINPPPASYVKKQVPIENVETQAPAEDTVPEVLNSDEPRIEIADPTSEEGSDDIFSLSMTSDVDEIDEDQPLAAALDKSLLTRASSLGSSWGVTAVGRGFDWNWNNRQGELEKEESARLEHGTHDDNEGRPATRKLQSETDTQTSGADTGEEPNANPLPPPRGAAGTDGEFRHLDIGRDAEQRSQEESALRASPSTPTLSSPPHSPSMMRKDVNSSSRPIIAGRSQSMYILPGQSSPVPGDDDLPLQPTDHHTSPTTRAQRARAWSRPVSPVRSPTLPNPRLSISPSAPSLAAFSAFGSFSPLTPLHMITGGALTTPLTPRSPRLNRSRASQKRISLVAGRQVAGPHQLDADGLPRSDEDEWLSFGRGRTTGSPIDSPDEDMPFSLSRSSAYDEGGEDAFASVRTPSASSDLSRRRSRSRPLSPLETEEDGLHVGRAGQIKSLGLFNSSLFKDREGPPTPLRTPSFVRRDTMASAVSRSASADDEVPRVENDAKATLNVGGFSTSGSFASLVAQAPEDVHIPPAEEEPPVYQSLDRPHPDWSLQRMSSSWSISSSSHQHRPSTSCSLRRSDSNGRSPSADKRGSDDIVVLMKRMKSSQSVKRLSSESGRRGGFLGGRTIDDYVILADAGRGAYGLVKRAKERKKAVVEINENGDEVIVEDVQQDETIGPPLIIKQIIKSRILADCWKKHPIHGTIPIEIYVMSALSGTSYVLPKPRAWDPRRFEDPESTPAPPSPSHLNGHRSFSGDSQMSTPGPLTPRSNSTVHITLTPVASETVDAVVVPKSARDDLTDLDTWRWREGDLIKGHPNICPLEDFFEDSSFYYLVLPATKPSFPMMPKGMEQAVEIGDRRPPSDLFDLVEMYPSGLPGPLIRSYLGQIADALSFLHARGICHRDVKDENVVLGEHGRCWLIDFGSSGVIRKNGWDSFSGTLDYASPEILQGSRYAGPPQDVWAFGIVAYVLFVGECPFASSVESALGLEDPEGKPALALRARCSGGPAGFDEGMEADGGGRLGDGMELVRKCLELEVAKRPTMEQLLTSRYLNGGQGWGQPVDGAEEDVEE